MSIDAFAIRECREVVKLKPDYKAAYFEFGGVYGKGWGNR